MGQGGGADDADLRGVSGAGRAGSAGRGGRREPRIQLPIDLRFAAFSVAEARAAGISKSRLRNSAEARPFRGVRVPQSEPQTAEAPIGVRGASDEFAALAARMQELDRSYWPVMSPNQAFGGVSAARLYGLPLPLRLLADTLVHVIVPKGRNPSRAKGVAARSIPPRFWRIGRLGGLPVASPELTYCLLARHLDVLELVQVGDALISDADNYPGRARPRALTTRDRLESAAHAWSGCAGAAVLRSATLRIRERVESPWESTTRIALVDSGYPEPDINVPLMSGARQVARIDLVDREARIGYDYEGDGHRTSQRQWRLDITRSREIESVGMRHVRLTVADLVPAAGLQNFTDYAKRLRAERLGRG
ncbi:hypothetical protein [Pseudoclavibacter sp. VKM Ac-2867]|uniref:hypothetical protein n=1 Tax=Pseudoclavibacter sp. VKM Ac-2867 TaxID=2783829 RepID=UPI00188B3E1F|nr:hypothetical protein [Pseudoclavibacter sp. VKM Ac-2867]MBF4457480.1 hypothetical protein [Pseudoclavibacter sp. VKM Ac-2867]